MHLQMYWLGCHVFVNHLYLKKKHIALCIRISFKVRYAIQVGTGTGTRINFVYVCLFFFSFSFSSLVLSSFCM